MTRFSKNYLPSSRGRHARKYTIVAILALSLIGIFHFAHWSGGEDTTPAITTSNNKTIIDPESDFYQMIPEPGELSPITWKEDGEVVAPNAYRISIPPELTKAMKEYCDRIGMTDLARNLILSEENNIEPDGYRFIELDGLLWFAQRPAKKWLSDMHWISPADESGHEVYLQLLRENGFLSVLNTIGEQLDLDGLAAYHLTFIVVSHCEEGFVHYDTRDTGDKVFNVIIPLETARGSPPELVITDYKDGTPGRLKYEENVAILIGDDVHHATSECDYRDNPGTMRLAATVYVADINQDNAETIASTTLTQAFPPPDAKWVYSER